MMENLLLSQFREILMIKSQACKIKGAVLKKED